MSSDQTAIQVSNLCKYYQIYQKPEDRLKQYILPTLQRISGQREAKYFREFKALDNISFEVKRGEAVGIVGRNGAGKSTLLQLICGTLTPTSGSITVNGRVAALLELGSGFNPEFTGRENVFLNTSVLGLSTAETDQRFDEIADFADIGEFIDQPVKTYSSGMLMRLAFAVNTCVEPDILIVDEALGVGDAPFQSKCFKRLRNLINLGTTVLFVSHDISTVRSVCSRALWLKQGHVEMWGDAIEVSKSYEKFCWKEEGVVMELPDSHQVAGSILPEIKINRNTSSAPAILFEPNKPFEKNRSQTRTGTGDVVIKNFLILNSDGHAVSACKYDEKLKIYYLLEICRQVNSDFVVGLRVRDLKGNFIYSLNDIDAIHRLEGLPGEHFVISADISFPLTHQDYVILTGVFGFSDGTAFTDGAYDFSKSIIWDVIEEAAFIKVNQHTLMPLVGPVNATYKLEVMKIN